MLGLVALSLPRVERRRHRIHPGHEVTDATQSHQLRAGAKIASGESVGDSSKRLDRSKHERLSAYERGYDRGHRDHDQQPDVVLEGSIRFGVGGMAEDAEAQVHPELERAADGNSCIDAAYSVDADRVG